MIVLVALCENNRSLTDHSTPPCLCLYCRPMIYKTPLLCFFGLSLQLGAAECNVMRTVPIRLLNDAAVTPRVVIAAQNEAAWILRSLWVEIEWVRSPSTKALEIRIIAAPLRQNTTPFALGMTILNVKYGNRATVFFSRVREAP